MIIPNIEWIKKWVAEHGGGVDWDETPTEGSRKAVRSGGVFSWVSNLLSSLTLAWDKITGKPETFPPSAHTHDKIVDGVKEVRADLTAKVQSGWTDRWEPSHTPIPENPHYGDIYFGDVTFGGNWGCLDYMWNGVSWEPQGGNNMLGDSENPDATVLQFPDGTPTHRVPATAETQLLTHRDIAAPDQTADMNAVAGAKATGDALEKKADEFTEWIAVPSDIKIKQDTDGVSWVAYKGNEASANIGDANSTYLHWTSDMTSFGEDVTATRKRVLRTGDALTPGLDDDGEPLDPNVRDLFSKSDTFLTDKHLKNSVLEGSVNALIDAKIGDIDDALDTLNGEVA